MDKFEKKKRNKRGKNICKKKKILGTIGRTD